MAAGEEEDLGGDGGRQLVALYDFDPSTIDWPFQGQEPLPLVTGQVIQVVLDDQGSEWALGHLKGRPDVRGYFPKNYTMTVAEYTEMIRSYEDQGGAEAQPADVGAAAAHARSDGSPAHGQQPAAPGDPLAGTTRSAGSDFGGGGGDRRPSGGEGMGAARSAGFEGFLAGGAAGGSASAGLAAGAVPAASGTWQPAAPSARPEVVAWAEEPPSGAADASSSSMAHHPPMSAQPPVETVYEPNRSRMARQMPPVPVLPPEDCEEADDDIARARKEVERELASMTDPYQTRGGTLSMSRASTPATVHQSRPDRDFVRGHLPMNLQDKYLRHVSYLSKLVHRTVRKAWEERPAYSVDMRVRATTVRTAARMEPPHLRAALKMSQATGARWSQMFRPGYNDIVNESCRTGCNACILSDLYVSDDQAREQFQKMHARDVNGVLWFELQRRKDSIYYTRMDFVDVMMHHPDAWSFPDSDKIVIAHPGEPVDPFHGWYAQSAINAEKEIQDVDFLYTLRLRSFPAKTFQALALGKMPEWVDPYASLKTSDSMTESGEPASSSGSKAKKYEVDQTALLSAGLDDSPDVFIKIDKETGQLEQRQLVPDVLDSKVTPIRIKGLSAMRIYLRSRGNPDNMKQTTITPKMVKDMAAALGIRHEPGQYWYCMFAMRYPLSSEWEVVVRDDTRWYVHLPTDTLQAVHPMIKRFREHLDECIQNEFLWANREPPVCKFKCAECGVPDAILWCMQCTDYFCAPCFFETHRSARGKKHWPMPVPGCRYLTASESARLRDHLPLLNVGFSNRRRFLARDNQSDKNGSRQGDTWLFFHADTFQSALQQAPEKHWLLKRLKPPRLAPGAEGYFYNFQNDVIADDASYILTKAHEQKALSILQKNMRGAIVRRRIKKEKAAVKVIQGAKRMWDVRKVQGHNGANSEILKKWYGKHRAIQDKEKLEYRMSRVQAVFAGFEARRDFHQMLTNVRRFQATWRGILQRRRHTTLRNAVMCIQRQYKGRLYGRKPMREQRLYAARIQAMTRGVARRNLERTWTKAATVVQAHTRGLLDRLLVKRMKRGAVKVQSNWRRFQAQLDVKIIVYERLSMVRSRKLELIREKLEDAAALLIQRNFRRHSDRHLCIHLKREKGEAEKRISTMFVALASAAASMRHFVHPFFRHLPKDIQEVLMQIKASLQRTIGLVPVTGKLASEELGRRSLRADGAKGLDQSGQDVDLASHLLLSVSRHLLSHLPPELFESTVKWTCYAIGHQACEAALTDGSFPKEVIPVGKDPNLPPHPGDSLATFWEDVGTIRHHHDWLMTTSDESLPCLMLHGMASQHRHVYLTAQVLVTMRQALDAPNVSTEDHLKFQGLDAAAGAQLMEVLGSELDHRLPLDWPKMHGTVSALANQMNTHIVEELKLDTKELSAAKDATQKVAEKATKAPSKGKAKSGGAKGKAKSKAGAKAAAAAAAAAEKDKISEELGDKTVDGSESLLPQPVGRMPDLPEGGNLSHFNRKAAMRILQQLGYFMVGQKRVLDAVLGEEEAGKATGTMGAGATGGAAVRQSRYISVTDKLFEMADRATHDHCSFALAVVLYHLVIRSLMLRVLYHRAAVAIQVRYRYLRNKGLKARAIGPSIRIQRHWRGVWASLRLMRLDDAAEKIQTSYRAYTWIRRSRRLVAATLKVQRVWHSAVHRAWLRKCHKAAQQVQRFARGMLVRQTLDKAGRESMRRYQADLREVMLQKRQLPESLYIARTAAIAGEARVAMHRHRQKKIDLLRMERAAERTGASSRQADKQKRLRMRGAIQPARLSVFEPPIFALKRLDPPAGARYGAKNSRVLQQVADARRKLLRDLPPKSLRVAPPHVCSRRGRAAVATRRIVKKVGGTATLANPVDSLIEDSQFELWHEVQFAVGR